MQDRHEMGWERETSPLEASFAAFFAEVARATSTPERVARAFRSHLAGIDTRQLPPAACPHWEAAWRLLKSPPPDSRGPDADRLDKATQAMASWPAARLQQLLTTLGQARREIDAASDQRWNDTIREQVAKAYL